MAALRTLVFNVVFYTGSLFFVLLGLPLTLISAPAVKAVARGWSRFHRVCVAVILGIRVRVEGTRPTQQVFYALRHESFFEAIDLPYFLKGAPVAFAKAELMEIPLWGRLAASYGLIGVERTKGASALRAMRRAAQSGKDAGRDFAIFPEGTRTPVGTAPAMQAGLYGIYRLLDLPLVPVAVDSGALYQASPKRPGIITYRIAEPIPPGLSRAELDSQVRAAINALNDQFVD